MINAKCTTNLDELSQELWPEQFVAVPRIGDWVESRGCRRLKVVSITHAMARLSAMASDETAVPIVLIELHN